MTQNSLADETREALEITVFKDLVTEEVHKGCSIIGLYPATDAHVLADFAAWRTKNHR